MEDMIEALQIYFSRANAWTPLWVTLKTGIAATFITFFTGLFAAARVMRLPSGKKAVADSILTLPIVLPPTVVGFVLFALIQQEQTAWKDIESGLRSRDSGDMGGLRHCGGGHFFSTDVPQYTCSL